MNQFAVSSIDQMAVASEGEQIAMDFLEGRADRASAEVRLNDWRLSQRQIVDDMRATAERLARGPDIDATAFPGTEEMRSQPLNVVGVVEAFFNTADSYFAAIIRGESDNPNLYIAAQYLVIASYTDGLAQLNRATANGLQTNHPQHHLLNSFVANMEMSVLFLELARQRLGADPSRFSPADFEVTFEHQLTIVENSVAAGELAYTSMVALIDEEASQAARSAQASYRIVGAMMETYPQSFENELRAHALFQDWNAATTPVTNPVAFDAFFQELGAYETIRDQLQIQRQQLGAQLR